MASGNCSINRLAFVCMGIATIFGRSGLVVFSARAFPQSSSFTRHRLLSSSTHFVRGGALLASEGNNDEDNKVPATGWNHNKPSEDSSFWASANGEKENVEQQQAQQKEESKATRTGWLHNTAPKKEKKDEKPSGLSIAQQRLQLAMAQQERNHRIFAPPTFHSCGNDRQIVVTEHRVSVPVFRPNKQPRIDLYFTIVEEIKDEASRQWFQSLGSMTPQQRASAYVEKAALKNADEMMVYLQGGPGFGAPTPVVGLGFSGESSWGAKALTKYKRIVLMDQRGTGKSTPITKQSLEKRFPELFLLDDKGENNDLEKLKSSYPEEFDKFEAARNDATNFLVQFRADNIVYDAEEIRDTLMLPQEPGSDDPGPRPWGCALGQSFGGFCMMSYLSLIERPPKICLLTGGIAPMLTPAYDAYSSLWERVRDRSLLYYEMYPGDIKLVKKIVKDLLANPAKLPSGGLLTARRFLQLGMSLGGGPSAFANMHTLFNSAYLLPDETVFTKAFLKDIDSQQPFDDAPIYYWLHESIYGDGPKNSPTNWAAHRAYEDKIKTPSEFNYELTSQLDSDERPILFFGEMTFPWMAEDYAECAGVGCSALVSSLHTKDDWGPLYDGAHMRKVLGDGTSRAAAAVYYDDMFVDFDCCMKVTSRGGPLEKCKVYITNEYQHSGLRDDGANIFSKLHGMATGSVRTPS